MLNIRCKSIQKKVKTLKKIKYVVLVEGVAIYIISFLVSYVNVNLLFGQDMIRPSGGIKKFTLQQQHQHHFY